MHKLTKIIQSLFGTAIDDEQAVGNGVECQMRWLGDIEGKFDGN